MSRLSIPERDRNACTLCGARVVPEHRPFCSRGCRDRDLLAWLDDSYRVPGPPADEDEIARDGLDRSAAPPL